MPLLRRFRRYRIPTLVYCLFLGLLGAGLSQRKGPGLAKGARDVDTAGSSMARAQGRQLPAENAWHDSLGDGFPDSARLEGAQDRENFVRWFTFLAEVPYYAPARQAQEEVKDCSALVRYAFRNALMAHGAAWYQAAGLPFEPGFGDVAKFAYPRWPLGPGLFRARPGPLGPADLQGGAFTEFADSATLLRYNTFLVSRELRAARPGDLLFFFQPAQREPYHTMIFVGNSHFQPRGSDWIVYHTGDLHGRRGQIREIQASTLSEHPDPQWRPFVSNLRFLGIYRFEILR